MFYIDYLVKMDFAPGENELRSCVVKCLHLGEVGPFGS